MGPLRFLHGISVKSMADTSNRAVKYLNPVNYYRFARNSLVRGILKCGVPLRVTTRVDDQSIRFVVGSFLEYSLRARNSYTREQVTMQWIRDYIQPDDIVYDIGANVGAYSLLIGKKVALGAGKVLAFEPESANYYSLNRNVQCNSLTGVVVPYPIAFGNRSRPSVFFLSSTVPGSAMHSVDKPVCDGESFSPRYVQGIYVVSVDEFCAADDSLFPNHIKIDVDGLEKQVVESMRQVLQDSRLRTVMIEIADQVSNGHVESMIRQHGFAETLRERWPGKEVYNILYVRQS